jgi:hypothetical protein
MTGLTWPDNICTVGWTCVHGIFTREDLFWLKRMCSEGDFSPTFYNDIGSHGNPAAYDRPPMLKVGY